MGHMDSAGRDESLQSDQAYNQINLLNGYGVLTIVTPPEVLFDDEPE